MIKTIIKLPFYILGGLVAIIGLLTFGLVKLIGGNKKKVKKETRVEEPVTA